MPAPATLAVLSEILRTKRDKREITGHLRRVGLMLAQAILGAPELHGPIDDSDTRAPVSSVAGD